VEGPERRNIAIGLVPQMKQGLRAKSILVLVWKISERGRRDGEWVVRVHRY
jgi:hypothetical protein